MTSPFEVLGVSWDADDETVRAAFRKAAKACHPDLKDGDEAAARQFKQITAARDSILKGTALRARVGRPLLVGPGELEDCTFEIQEFGHAFNYQPIRLRQSVTAGGVIFALLAACVISSAMVFLPQRGATALQQAIAGVLDMKTLSTKILNAKIPSLNTKIVNTKTLNTKTLNTKTPDAKTPDAKTLEARNSDLATRGSPATADLRLVSIDAPESVAPDGQQTHPPVDAAPVSSSPPQDTSPPQEAPSQAPIAASIKLPRPRPDRHKGHESDARSNEPRRVIQTQAAAMAMRTTEGRTSAGVAPPGRAAVAPLPLQPSVVPSRTSDPEGKPSRPAHTFNGCWTDEGSGRWSPCGGGNGAGD